MNNGSERGKASAHGAHDGQQAASAARASERGTRAKNAASQRGSEPAAALPGIDAVRVAVAHRVTAEIGRQQSVKVSGGALRVLLAFEAASDAAGRFATAYGEGRLFESKTYYQHVAALEAAGLIRRLPRRDGQRRHCEVTARGKTTAAKVGRLIEAAAIEFITGTRHAD